GGGASPVLLPGFGGPVPMAVILCLDRWHRDHLPHLTLPMRIAEQHAPQLAHVQPLALGSTPVAVDLNGGGIHHGVGDPVPLQKPMQPEAFAPRFIATDHGGRFRQTQATLSLGAFVKYALVRTCGHGALEWRLTLP